MPIPAEVDFGGGAVMLPTSIEVDFGGYLRFFRIALHTCLAHGAVSQFVSGATFSRKLPEMPPMVFNSWSILTPRPLAVVNYSSFINLCAFCCRLHRLALV